MGLGFMKSWDVIYNAVGSDGVGFSAWVSKYALDSLSNQIRLRFSLSIWGFFGGFIRIL